jgi:hypothetical protein
LSQNRSESVFVGDTEAIKLINDLKLVINRQNLIINNVVTRLNFLLSMFNIDEVSMPTPPTSDHSSLEDGNIGGTSSIDQWPVLSSHHAHSDHAVQPSPAVTNTSTKQLYSSVTGHTTQPKQTEQQFTKLRQSLVAAVYIDQRDRDNRASSFIISGLPISTDQSDTTIVKELCSNEFNI